jgi:hypothetical protein
MNSQISQTSLVAPLCGAAVIDRGLGAQVTGATNFFRLLTLAPADDVSSDAGGAGDEQAQQTDLVKTSVTPEVTLTSIPIQNSFDFGMAPAGATPNNFHLLPGNRTHWVIGMTKKQGGRYSGLPSRGAEVLFVRAGEQFNSPD